MNKEIFSAELRSIGPGGSKTYVRIPFSVEHVFGRRGHVAVTGTINNIPFHGLLALEGTGMHSLLISDETLSAAKVKAGDTVEISLQPADEEKQNIIPDDFKYALAAFPDANDLFNKMPFSHQKEYIQYINEAKKPETRIRRIEKSIEMISAGRPIK